MKKAFYALLAVAGCFGIGFLGNMLQAEAMVSWYPGLDKSWVTPPNSFFQIGWGVSYLCIGLSLTALIYDENPTRRAYFMSLYAAQLFMRFLWVLVFYHFQQPLAGLVVSVVLIALIVWYMRKSKEVSVFASKIYIPYLAWTIFVAYLNFYIVLKN